MEKIEFKDAFGISMREFGNRLGVSGQYISQVFKTGKATDDFFDEMIQELKNIAETNLENEISVAQYRHKVAEKMIRDLEEGKSRGI